MFLRGMKFAVLTAMQDMNPQGESEVFVATAVGEVSGTRRGS